MTAVAQNEASRTSAFGNYLDRVTVGLLADVLEVFARHGIPRCDEDPVRLARALKAICHLADVLAGPLPG